MPQRLLDKLERTFGRFAVPNLTVYLIAGQTFFYVLYMTGKLERSVSILAADRLLAGEWWRLATFPFDPPGLSIIFAFFAWYLFYLMGSALEEQWGSFRYNAYILIGYLLTVAVSFLIPAYPVSNTYIAGSVFLAFAFLYPDFTLMLFFVLPVRIKWLALLTWLYYGVLFLTGGGPTRLLVLASVGNFLIFFANDLRWLAKREGRQLAKKNWQPPVRSHEEPLHRCTVCGITDKTHPRMDFRYCPQCAGQHGYCQEHIFSHEHVKE
ncbi:rhomboid family intramembrane serine protease [Geomobilimonas luticola]|uniref:Rhomboid family intramembrane serine protease n=1 Tax=Geomobilimonas luticola TaxID=1114878 RepID=A0ABS5SE96_9BACT|nr:rhomboid family intramembrane serine protease [Geomobilimonas luticola]MBT0653685.1 rhomboid family intramembrane serine protease [Geomobilimonas luticola]